MDIKTRLVTCESNNGDCSKCPLEWLEECICLDCLEVLENSGKGCADCVAGSMLRYSTGDPNTMLVESAE